MRRVAHSEDGATAVLIAILMMVFMGFTALVVDVGGMHSEVRQLQNVADAAAMAVAQDCAGGACGDTTATAQFYASANSKDLLSNTAVALPGDAGTNSVTVTASTREASGGNDAQTSTLTWALAQVMGQNEVTFQRKATARWGVFGGGATIPIAICERNWNTETSNGTVLPSGSASDPTIIKFGTPNANSANATQEHCSNPSFDTYPGGFGFLERDANCMAITSAVDAAGTWYAGDPGNNPNDPQSSCGTQALYAMLKAIVDRTPPEAVLIPIFDAYRGTGTGAEFRIKGYGAFVLRGYKFQGGGQNSSYMMTASECEGWASCLKGYYTHFVSIDEAATYTGGNDYGAYYIGLSG